MLPSPNFGERRGRAVDALILHYTGMVSGEAALARLLDAAAEAGLDFVPGVQTASEIMACLERGFDVMKFFPASQAGGLPTLRALAGPFPQVAFCPTGGISEDQAGAWLEEPNVLAVGGSWLAPAGLVERGDWEAITGRARRSMERLAV